MPSISNDAMCLEVQIHALVPASVRCHRLIPGATHRRSWHRCPTWQGSQQVAAASPLAPPRLAAPQAVACSSRESIEEFSWFHMQVQSTPQNSRSWNRKNIEFCFFTVMHALQWHNLIVYPKHNQRMLHLLHSLPQPKCLASSAGKFQLWTSQLQLSGEAKNGLSTNTSYFGRSIEASIRIYTAKNEDSAA